jgi:uncharacterized protein YjbJ (UPF0337 family)
MNLNDDVVSGRWKQVRGRIRELRGELQHDEAARVTGALTRWAGWLQEQRGRIVSRFERGRKRVERKFKL